MDWLNILNQIFEIAIIPLIGVGTTYLIFLINTKINEIKQKTNNEKFNEYLSMLNSTIEDCVIATTQTYVLTLKKEGVFDAEAQKIAFNKTYEAVMAILTEDAKKYLNKGLADLNEYVYNKIESEVAMTKSLVK